MKDGLIVFFLLSFLPLSAQPEDLPSFTPERAGIALFEEQEIMADGGCSLACAIGWELSATSTLASQQGNAYGVSNMEDGRRNTAWVEGIRGYGTGQRITLTFLPPDGDNPEVKIPFHGILITNGYSKNAEVWSKNSRVKKLLVWVNSKKVCYLELDDDLYPQEFIWTPNLITVGSGDVVNFEIVEVYPGSHYEDTAISDIGFYGAH